jgi:hypothetical protein
VASIQIKETDKSLHVSRFQVKASRIYPTEG